MTWLVIGAEGLIIIAIIVWMAVKLRAIGNTKEESDTPPERPEKPELNLPEEEKWE